MSAFHGLDTILQNTLARQREVESFADAAGWTVPAKEPDGAFAYKVYSCADVLGWPDLEWRVHDVLPTVGIASMWGPSRAGKSFIALDMALAISFGSDWFGKKTKSCAVLYIALEASRGLKKRLQAWMQEKNSPLPDTLNFIVDRLDLQKPENVQAIIKAAPQNGMVIIDTLNRAAPCADENSSRDMGQIISAAASIQEATDGLVLIVTHTGKDEKKGARGHSSLFAALDGGVEIVRNGDTRTIKFTKVKDEEDGATSDFQLQKVIIGRSPDGDPVTSCVVEPVARQEKEKALTPTLKYALDSLIKACGDQTGVHLEGWRDIFYSGHAGDTHEAKRQAFVRARKDLISKELASVKDDFYTPRQTRQNPDIARHVWQDFNPDRQDTLL